MATKILLIEDSLEMRENTAEILELANYKVHTAENGKTGIEMAVELMPDIIICDIMMPEKDGYEVLYLLGKNPKTASIPFIFLSAKAEKSDLRKGMDLGADDYLTKPFEEMELLNAVESRIKRSEIFKSEYTNNLDGLNAFLNNAQGLDELQKLSEDRKLRTYRKKETIYLEGEFPNGMFYINKGNVKTYRMTDDGKEYTTGLYKKGEFIGYMALLENSDYTETAEAIEDSELFRIPKNDFLLLLEKNRDVANKFIKLLSSSVIEKEEQLLNLAYNSVRKRVAEALIMLKNKYMDMEESKEDFTITISRDDLASIVGTATETVIRTLSEFKEYGLIKVKGRSIVILDANGLANLEQ